ncbi:MAG: site-2 protease family protein [Nannocystaceae bacterium]|nr:site-2 protease family protein [Nannocystaceae bacterium]
MVQGERLRDLAALAATAKQAEDPTAELVAWREALTLLPNDARQAAVIRSRIATLGQAVDASPRSQGPAWTKGLAGAGGLALLLWKFKAVVLFAVTKGKALVFGFTKLGTLAGVLASFGVYWAAWGWKFAAGLIISLYIHEIGHVVTLRRFGIAASAPAFIPGLGAFVRLEQYPANEMENARVGMAGPIWGTVAAVAALSVYAISDWASFAAIARFGAWINLFNLLPLGPLDGGRGFGALNRSQRWLATGVLALAWFVTAEGLLGLLVVAAAIRAFSRAPAVGDRRTLLQYTILIAILAGLCGVEVPVDTAGS